jgi:hypothetical protein
MNMQSAKSAHAQQYSDMAKDSLLELQEQAKKVISQNPELGAAATAAAPAPAPAETYSAPTKVVFTGLAVWEHVQICCSSQPPVMANTDIWGLTAAIGGISWGTAWFSVPFSQLPSLGDLTIQVNIASVAVHISWWKSGTPIGTFVGGGIGIGVAILGGNCKFQNGTC